MPTDSSREARSRAIELLHEWGLTEYEARVYVTLLQLGTGTARQISDTSTVPRTRVYGLLEALAEQGLVEIQHASPKVARPVVHETIIERFQMEYEGRINQLSTLLTDLESTERQHKQPGVWAVTGRETVTERVLEFIDAAEEEVVYMSVDHLLTKEIIAALAAAEQRGVAIRLAGSSPAAYKRLDGVVSDLDRFETLWEFSETAAGRLVMVDRETILSSVLIDGGFPEETAIWASGEHNSLVVVLKAIFTWQINHSN